MALDKQTASHDIAEYNGMPNSKSKFECYVCVDVFFDCKYCFKNHKQLHHIKTVYVSFGKILYKCNDCIDVYFECKHCLNEHKVQLHSNNRSHFKMCDNCSQMYADKCESFSNQEKLREELNNLLYSKIDNFHLMCDCFFIVGFIVMVYLFYLSNSFLYIL